MFLYYANYMLRKTNLYQNFTKQYGSKIDYVIVAATDYITKNHTHITELLQSNYDDESSKKINDFTKEELITYLDGLWAEYVATHPDIRETEYLDETNKSIHEPENSEPQKTSTFGRLTKLFK